MNQRPLVQESCGFCLNDCASTNFNYLMVCFLSPPPPSTLLNVAASMSRSAQLLQTLREETAQYDAKHGDGRNVIHARRCDDQGGDTLVVPVALFLQLEQSGHDHGRTHSAQDEPEKKIGKVNDPMKLGDRINC